MGNDLSSGPNRLAISSLCHVVKFDKAELLRLQKEFSKLAAKSGEGETISKDQFQDALALVGIHETDREMLSRIFVMLDKGADGTINFREFVVGIAPIVRGNLVEKLRFAFDLYDVDGTRTITQDEMLFVFRSMNHSVTFFGDEALPDETVRLIVEEVFRDYDHDKSGSLSYDEFMEAVGAHPSLVEFVGSEPSGK